MRDKAEHLSAYVLAINGVDVQAVEKRGGGRDSFLLVIHRADAAVEEGRCRRLAEIVGDRAKHHDDSIRAIQVVDALPRLVDHHQRVHPHVAFRMPFRFLLAADQCLQLRKQLVDDAELQRERRTRLTGRCARSSSFSISPQMRSGGRSSSRIDRHSAPVCSSSVSSNRAANWTARRTRRLSSPNVCRSTALRILRSRSSRPFERDRRIPRSADPTKLR